MPSAYGESGLSKHINYNLSCRIPGTKEQSSKKNIPKPNKNPNIINNYYTEGVIPGYKYDANYRYKSPKNMINYEEISDSKSGFRSPKINMSTIDWRSKAQEE